MFRNICKLLILAAALATCSPVRENKIVLDVVSTNAGHANNKSQLTGYDFKVPVPQGYDWEITQSWEKHCDYCNSKGYGGTFGDYCQLSHATNDPAVSGCFSYCKFGWDFNLSGNDDLGRPVLASGDGTVLYSKVGKKSDGSYKGGAWGNTVVIDHGNNICSRYSHMKDGSVTVNDGYQVCQGLKIGEIGGTPSLPVHLHFQFESCDTHLPLEMGFTDGNEVPKCVMGSDRYTDGAYTAINLTNVEKAYCTEEDLYQKDPIPATTPTQVCDLQCPMNQKCGQTGTVPFNDLDDSETSTAAAYLWHECAVSGKSDGDFHKDDKLTRAEALKIALALFGLDKGCEGSSEPFLDVNPYDWFHPYVVCGVKRGIISADNTLFYPDREVSFAEAAKMAVESAVKAGKAQLKTGMYAKFQNLRSVDWPYKYMQTVAYYNGVDDELLQKDPYDTITRGDYARMVAALSPCYCAKNKCQGGCECDQNQVCGAGTVSKDDVPGSGQYGGGMSEDAGSFYASSGKDASGSSAGDVCPLSCTDLGKNCGVDFCGNSCGTCPSGMFCAMGSKCDYICMMPSCSDIGCECGTCPLSTPGCEGSSIGCGECRSGSVCNNNKCEAVTCYNCPPERCDQGMCMFDLADWKCDPAKGYTFTVSAYDDGQLEVFFVNKLNELIGYNYIALGNFPYEFHLPCDELPVLLDIEGGKTGFSLSVEDNTLPPFDIFPVYGVPFSTTIYSTYNADIYTSGPKVLIRIPSLLTSNN